MNKKSFLVMFAILLMTNILFSQNVTLRVTLLNGKSESVELKSAYDKDAPVYGKAKISDNQFTLKTKIPSTDLYALAFSSNQSFLLCLNPGDNITLTIDESNLQNVPSVSGSESMLFIKNLTDVFVSRQKVLDSLNHAVQTDRKQLYFTTFASKFQPYHQSFSTMADDISAALEQNDSLVALTGRYAPKGTVDKKSAEQYINASIKVLKVMKNYFASYRNFVTAVQPAFENSLPAPIQGYNDFGMNLTAYTKSNSDYREEIDVLLNNYMTKAEELVAQYDDEYYDGKMDSPKAQVAFGNRIAGLVSEYAQRAADSREGETSTATLLKTMGNQLIQSAQTNVQNIVNGYQQEFNRRDAGATAKARQLMLDHKADLAALMFLDNFSQDKAIQTEVVSALNGIYPEHPLVKDRWNKINTPQFRTAEGSIAPELEFNDPTGKTRKLSDLRGKVVLIDFWASWCGPCRRENPHVVSMYQKYHDKGFEVFSVSLDKDLNAWKGAIEKDGLVWPNHVSDLKGWGSAAAKLYGVSSIPCTFLIDKDGRILAKGLRGDTLTQALQQLFGE